MLGVVPVLALIVRSTSMADTDIETASPTIEYGVPGCTCGFTLVDAAAAPYVAASPHGEVGDDGKETSYLDVTRHKGGREGRFGDDKPLNVVVLLDGGDCKVFNIHDHRVAHLHLRILVHHAVIGNTSEPDELPFFEKAPAPHRFPSYPDLLVIGKPHPHAPCVIHANGHYGVFSTHSDYGGLGDGYMHILGHLLAELLLQDVDNKSASGVDGFIKGVNVSVDLGLGDFCVVAHDVVVDYADGNPVEALDGVLKCG